MKDPLQDRGFARHILDGLPVLVAYVDADLDVVLANPATLALIERTADETIGRPSLEVLGAHSRIYALLLECARTRKPIEVTIAEPVSHSSGQVRMFAAFLMPDLAEDGSFQGIFATAADVTGQVSGLDRFARFGESLSTILQAIARMTDPLQLLDTLAAETLKALGGEYSLVSIAREGSWVVTHRHGTGGEERVGVEYPLDERPVIDDAALTGDVQYVEDAATNTRVNRKIMERFGIRAFIAVPLTLLGSTLGVFEIVFTDGPHEFDQPTHEFLRNLTSAASVAYGRMREYQHEHRIADTLQSALLRLPAAIDGLHFASHYAAAWDEARVGGDFFDVFEIEGSRVGVTIGDVSGKGLAASIITSRVRDCLRLCAFDGLTPAECVTKTNTLLYRITPTDMFATLIFAIIDTATGELTYVTAAHPSGLLQRTDGSIVLLEGANTVVGAFPGLSYVQGTALMGAGDSLLLYTDGLTEARTNGVMFGQERIVDYLRNRPITGLEALVSDVFDTVCRYAEYRLQDDAAMLAVALAPRAGVSATALEPRA